jgi:hypothetical protein
VSKIGRKMPKNEKTHERIWSSNFWRDEGAKVAADERGMHRWQLLVSVGFKLGLFKLGPCLFRTR